MKIDREQNEHAIKAFEAEPEMEVTVHLLGEDGQEVSYPGYSPVSATAGPVMAATLIDFDECDGDVEGVLIAGFEVRGRDATLRLELQHFVVSRGVAVRVAVRCLDSTPSPFGPLTDADCKAFTESYLDREALRDLRGQIAELGRCIVECVPGEPGSPEVEDPIEAAIRIIREEFGPARGRSVGYGSVAVSRGWPELAESPAPDPVRFPAMDPAGMVIDAVQVIGAPRAPVDDGERELFVAKSRSLLVGLVFRGAPYVGYSPVMASAAWFRSTGVRFPKAMTDAVAIGVTVDGVEELFGDPAGLKISAGEAPWIGKADGS